MVSYKHFTLTSEMPEPHILAIISITALSANPERATNICQHVWRSVRTKPSGTAARIGCGLEGVWRCRCPPKSVETLAKNLGEHLGENLGEMLVESEVNIW